jgi:hypothetical protein
MRIIASLVIRNEADRYLESFLKWNSQWWDELFVYDDLSTDDTVEMCSEFSSDICHREPDESGFLQHEGEYRSRAWQVMGREMNLTSEDWVFSVDADEFLVTKDDSDIKSALTAVIEAAVAASKPCVSVNIPEVWDLSERPLQVRTDGFWATMRLPRLVRWNAEDGDFHNKPMGCGSTPRSNYTNQLVDDSIQLLHFGYALEEDRVAKHRRYTSLRDHGHNKNHIESIIKNPVTTNWLGSTPVAYRGTPV